MNAVKKNQALKRANYDIRRTLEQIDTLKAELSELMVVRMNLVNSMNSMFYNGVE